MIFCKVFHILIYQYLFHHIPRREHISLASKYHKRPPYEPADQTKYFDFWRLYYTAFSRAQDLLVLTANETNREPSRYFGEVYDELINYDNPAFDINDFDFKEVKDVNIKDTLPM